MEEEDDNDDQEEDTLFDKRKDVGRELKSALKAAKGGCEERVEVVDGGRGSLGTCGRWIVTLTLCASFLGLVNSAKTVIFLCHSLTR